MSISRPNGTSVNDEQSSPAARFARSRRLARYPLLADFAGGRPFVLDQFQTDGCRALEDGRGVLICAPTGAGKTVIGEFAVFRALSTGGKCFYTTPIKALSNQKYADLVAEHGAAKVGLLTGDTSINSHAPVVVMTTEVLRNMLYADSADLQGLTAVVMDEVHYLADKFRGAVWEEVILHLPERVQVVGLSATVSNAEEFGAWLQQVRGDTTVVLDEDRPVPLWQHMMVGRRLFDLFRNVVTPEPGRNSGATVQIDPALTRAVAAAEPRWAQGLSARGRGRPAPRRGAPPMWRSNRVEVIERLDGAGLLPAITFIFSRVGCEAALAQCARSGLRLVTETERARIREIVDAMALELPEADLGVLGFWEWREALERGIAAHHAGMLPAFKETVEKLFVAGLIKAVFATETLALGINMPARTVILEKLVKYNGEGHVDLTPGQYTQLTGRAGRRGIDVEGHAVVIWSPGVDPRQVGGLASRRTYPLRSSFGPSYNMAVNLIDRMGRVAAKELLQQSFAQFQADAGVVGLARQVHRGQQAMAEHDAQLSCHLGDVREYVALLTDLSTAEKSAAKTGAAHRKQATLMDLAHLKRGDVIEVPAGRRAGLAVVLDLGVDIDGVTRPLVVTVDRWSGRLSPADFRGTVPALGRIRLAKDVDHHSPQVRRDIASSISATRIDHPASPPGRSDQARASATEADLTALRKALRAHPVHGCADRDIHLQWARRRDRLAADVAKMQTKVDDARDSLGDQLDRILLVLGDRGYLEQDQLTDSGRVLARIWSESDLLTTECLRAGIWADLTPSDLAAAVSVLVFQARREVMARPVPGPAGIAIGATVRLWAELAGLERAHALRVGREPDAGFAGAMRVWAQGGTLAQALAAASASGLEVPAGDFVRWIRQVIDLLDQIHAAADPPVAVRAAEAVRMIRRGVVSLGTR